MLPIDTHLIVVPSLLGREGCVAEAVFLDVAVTGVESPGLRHRVHGVLLLLVVLALRGSVVGLPECLGLRIAGARALCLLVRGVTRERARLYQGAVAVPGRTSLTTGHGFSGRSIVVIVAVRTKVVAVFRPLVRL